MPALHSVDQHFSRSEPNVRRAYDRIVAAARTFGNVDEDPKKTSIHLVRSSAFAGVATRKQALILTIKSPTDVQSPRVVKREQASANRWHIEVRVEKPADVDKELVGWLEKAYTMS
jgi:hypothetical protein